MWSMPPTTTRRCALAPIHQDRRAHRLFGQGRRQLLQMPAGLCRSHGARLASTRAGASGRAGGAHCAGDRERAWGRSTRGDRDQHTDTTTSGVRCASWPGPDRRTVVGRVINHDRHSKLANAEHETRDDADVLGGYWTREQLIKMDDRFCRAMRKRIRSGKTLLSPRRVLRPDRGRDSTSETRVP
jgi:hypothetical protein